MFSCELTEHSKSRNDAAVLLYLPKYYYAYNQCYHIGQFITLWATFQSLRQQLFSPKRPHSQAIFVKVSKSFIFMVQLFLATFKDNWHLFTGHCCLQQLLIYHFYNLGTLQFRRIESRQNDCLRLG